MDTVRINRKNTLMVAHRGLSGLECENTLPAFIAAGKRSYFGIEADVHLTADGVFAVFHDDSTGRLTGKKLQVEKSSFRELQELELKGTGQVCRIPRLEEYLEICAQYGKISFLELKNPMKPQDIDRLMDILSRAGRPDDTIIISFSFANLLEVRRIMPEQRVQLIAKRISTRLIKRLALHGMDLDIRSRALTKRRLKKLHAAGVRVNCWTVDNAAAAEKLASWGVDFITTNILE